MKADGHFITVEARKRFKRWLADQEISFSEFARRAGVSRQYLENALHGKIKITDNVREWFKKGGYELL